MINIELNDCRIGLLGGDARNLFYIPALQQAGATVRAVGFEKAVGLLPCEVMEFNEVLSWANVLILPMGGTGPDGSISAQFSDQPLFLAREHGCVTRPDLLVLTGVARPYLKDLAQKNGWRLVEIADIDDLAILNSIPSAEGALQMAMEASDITIHHSNSFVLGFGRCGTTLARSLAGLGASVTVAARKPADLARIWESGYTAVPFTELAYHVPKADLIFNTAPALILTESLLQLTRPDVVIIDIASAPGGVDFGAAERLGRKAILAPSLPGRVAPRSAGQMLGRLLPRIIKENLTGGKKDHESSR